MNVPRPRDGRGLRYSHYDQALQAAVAGQGVALGRFPLIDPFIADRRLVMPLRDKRYAQRAQRAYWLLGTLAGMRRVEVRTFTDWLRAQVAKEAAQALKPVRAAVPRRQRGAA